MNVRGKSSPHEKFSYVVNSLMSLRTLTPVHSVAHDAADGSVVVAKTGMGSSAALVSSLVGALLSFFGAACLPCFDDVDGSSQDKAVPGMKESLDLTHNLAQACHCVAQGKVS